MILVFLYLACLLLSGILAIVNGKHLRSRQANIFTFYLPLLFVMEASMYIRFLISGIFSTGLIYNIYRPIMVTVFIIFYYRIPFNVSVRKMILGLYAIYLAVTACTFLFIKTIKEFNSYLSLAGGFVVTCCGIFFLFNYFNLDNLAEEKKWRPVIWITIGVIAFYPVINISFAFYKDLLALRATIFGTPLYQAIPRLMSIFMYSCFTYAFYLCKKKN